MVRQNVVSDMRKVRHGSRYASAHLGVLFHNLPLGVAERPCPRQHFFGDVDFAYIMQHND